MVYKKGFKSDHKKAVEICNILDENKGENISLIDVSYLSSIAEYFIVATANSTVHAKSLVDKVDEVLKQKKFYALRKDGLNDGRWIVLDYSDVIVHIFTKDIREFYNIEKLWGDGKNVLNMQGIKKLIEE